MMNCEYVVLACLAAVFGHYGPKILTRKLSMQKRVTAQVGAEEQPASPGLEIGPNLTKILGAFVAVLLIFAQAYVIYLNRETKAEVQNVRNETTRSLMQSEKNGARLKKQADDKLEAENNHRKMLGQPPLKGDIE